MTTLAKFRKLIRVLQVPLWRRSLRKFHVAASVEHQVVCRLIGPLDLIVDVGANRGQFALLARYCYPHAKIVSFEPLALPAQVFSRVFASDRCVKLFNSAIGPEQCVVPIHVSARDDSSSLLPIAELQSQTFPGSREVGTISVDVAPLSCFLSSADIPGRSLLKLDVQGYEYEALLGSESLLCSFSWILCECSFVELYTGQRLAAAVINWLAARGFFVRGVYNAYYHSDGSFIQADILFGPIS